MGFGLASDQTNEMVKHDRDRSTLYTINVRVIYLLMIIACFALVITLVFFSFCFLVTFPFSCIVQKKKKIIACFAFAYMTGDGLFGMWGCGGGGTIMSRASPLKLVPFCFCLGTHFSEVKWVKQKEEKENAQLFRIRIFSDLLSELLAFMRLTNPNKWTNCPKFARTKEFHENCLIFIGNSNNKS